MNRLGGSRKVGYDVDQNIGGEQYRSIASEVREALNGDGMDLESQMPIAKKEEVLYSLTPKLSRNLKKR